MAEKEDHPIRRQRIQGLADCLQRPRSDTAREQDIILENQNSLRTLVESPHCNGTMGFPAPDDAFFGVPFGPVEDHSTAQPDFVELGRRTDHAIVAVPQRDAVRGINEGPFKSVLRCEGPPPAVDAGWIDRTGMPGLLCRGTGAHARHRNHHMCPAPPGGPESDQVPACARLGKTSICSGSFSSTEADQWSRRARKLAPAASPSRIESAMP